MSAGRGGGPEIPSLHLAIVGTVVVVLSVMLALAFPNPSNFQRSMIAIFAGLGAAGIASAFTGFVEIESRWVRAGGPLGVFVFVCFYVWYTA
jgi:hypothetical protein